MTDSFDHLETVLVDVAYVKHLQAEVERLQADNARLTANGLSRFERDQIKALQAEVERLKAELKNDADEFEHLHEYWNGQPSSAVDACFHLFDRCEAAIERLQAIVEKGKE